MEGGLRPDDLPRDSGRLPTGDQWTLAFLAREADAVLMKPTLTRVAIILISLNAALAVAILAFGRMGDIEGRILGTSLLATTSALLAMVQVPALRGHRLGVAPRAGMVASGVGFFVMTTGMWTEADSAVWWKLGGSGYAIAVAGAMAAVLSGWPIRGRAAWVGSAAQRLIALGVFMVLGGIWFEIDNEAYGRAFAVLAVLLGAAGLAIPILHRSSTGRVRLPIEHCPFCGSPMSGETGTALVCEDCLMTFNIRVEA